jgi:hypothetical protein
MMTNVRFGLLLIAAATVILAADLSYLIWRIVRFQRLRLESQMEALPILRWLQRRHKFRQTGGSLR